MRLMWIYSGQDNTLVQVTDTDSETLHNYLASNDPGSDYSVSFVDYVSAADFREMQDDLVRVTSQRDELQWELTYRQNEIAHMEQVRKVYFESAAIMFNWYMTHTSDEAYALLREMSDATGRIQRIKLVRNAFGCDLLMAKRMVEILAEKYNYDF